MYLKERLADGQCLLGAGIYSYSWEVLNYSATGMDWVWLENQHTHASWETIVNGVSTARAKGIPAIVRSWTQEGGAIERLLDTGAEGIIVPMVNTPEQAEEIVSHCYYPPLGKRSAGSIRIESIDRDLNEWNKHILTVMMIETPQAVENVEAIANVHGVDALLIGATDLSLNMGKYVDFLRAHEDVKEEVKYVAEVCKKTGKAAATIAVRPEDLKKRIAEGYRLICAGMDVDHVRFAYENMQRTFKETMDKK